jgi:protein-S-isoprenylcysteine O-methyltransferase Ste14
MKLTCAAEGAYLSRAWRASVDPIPEHFLPQGNQIPAFRVFKSTADSGRGAALSMSMVSYAAVKWIWIVFCSFWLLAALVQKRNVRRQSMGSRLGQMAIVVVALAPYFIFHPRLEFLYRHFTRNSPAMQNFGILLMLLGCGFAVWARVTIGSNWSGVVTVKENHALITRGPYAWVRHPIYSGVLLMLLGTAVTLGTIINLLEVPAIALAFWLKLRTEEKFMLETFGEQYVAYRRQVRALIPRVI